MFAYRVITVGRTGKAKLTDVVYRKRAIDPDELFTRYELEQHSIDPALMRGEWYSEFRTWEDTESITDDTIITRHTRYPYVIPEGRGCNMK